MVQVQMSDGASKRLVNGTNKTVDNRMTERSWEDKSRQEEHGAILSGNFSHPAQLKCSLGQQLYMERCIDAKPQ
jgi:hypothetical protein